MKLWIRLLLLLTGGGLIPLCFPPYGYWPLMIVSLALLFRATQNLSSRPAFYSGLLYGVVGFGISLRWFFEIFSIAALVLYLILAFFVGLFCVLKQSQSAHQINPKYQPLLLATIWSGIEFYRCELFFLQFPWITPGTSIGVTWLTSVLGVYGCTFLVVLAAIYSTDFKNRKTSAIILLLATAMIGFWKPGRVELDPEQDRTIDIVLVQSESSAFPTYQLLTQSMETQDPDWIVWPEYAVPYDVRQNPREMEQLHELCATQDAVLTLGTQTSQGAGETNWRNTALTLDHEKVLGEYYKARPVHFFNDGIPGKSFHCIETPYGKVGTPVCFDGDGSEVIRKIASNGAELFIVPIYDASHWTEIQHLQHAALFQIRAAETGRWFACAASSGVTQVIDPNGNVTARIPLMRDGILEARAALVSEKTFYVQAGWIFPWMTLALTCMFMLSAAIQNIRHKQYVAGKIRPPDLE